VRKSLSLIVITLALAACGGSAGGIAATVNGIDITVAEVQAMRVTDDAATIDKAAFATDLTDAIIDRAVVNAAKDEFSIAPTQAELDAKVAELTTQIEAAQGVSVEEFFSSRSLPLDRLRGIANQQVVRDKLYDHFVAEAVPATDADANLLLTADPIGRINACVRHILVATEQEATNARERIEAGEEFAAVAGDVGTDGTAANGGDLGCEPLGLYVSEFATAAADAQVGVVSEPVESQFGWHLILVESREEPSLTEIKDEITLGRVNQLVDAWVINIIQVATVSVESQYGTWVTDPNPMVVAPVS
jgi:parvulin-like peptidyl-prolyl isomerase